MSSTPRAISKTPAAVSAGIAMKNDSSVAVTRSMPRISPAEIVAPERETPGMSEKHWTRPMTSPSLTVIASSPRCTPCFSRTSWRRSATQMTALQRMSAPATTQRLRSGPEMRSLSEEADDADRQRADDDGPGERVVVVLARLGADVSPATHARNRRAIFLAK